MNQNQYWDGLRTVEVPFTEDMGASRQPRRPLTLDPWRDIQLGLATASSLQTSIRHADTKAATLLATEGAVATAVTEPAVSLLSAGPTVSAMGTVLLVGMVTGLAVASWHLIHAMRPQLAGVASDNRFGFPNLVRAGRRPPPASAYQQRNEAWEFVGTLAQIAMGKHTRVRRSLPWLVTSLAAAGLVIIMRLTLSVAS